MNYALDALWWKLEHKNIRDLASLLTAPTLWHTGCELPVNILLGDTGFRYLLSLNENPEPLVSFLEKEFPHKFRLGFYAEFLLKFWLSHSPHWTLLAHNIAVSEGKQTIGAIDFIAQTKEGNDSQIYHIELTCKYYLSADTKPKESSFIGFNPKDCLNKKVDKLKQQLTLTYHPNFLFTEDNIVSNIKNVSLVRGNAYTLSGELPLQPTLNTYAWGGKIISSSSPITNWQNKRFSCIDSMDLLSPARVSFEQTLSFSQLKQVTTTQVIALVDKRYDGFYHEQERFVWLTH